MNYRVFYNFYLTKIVIIFDAQIPIFTLKIENREKYEEDNKEEKCEEEDKDTETINKGGQSKKHKEDK